MKMTSMKIATIGGGPSRLYKVKLFENGQIDKLDHMEMELCEEQFQAFNKLDIREPGEYEYETVFNSMFRAGYPRIDVLEIGITARTIEMYEWLNENIGRFNYVSDAGFSNVWFLNNSDKVMFMLRWQ